MRGVEPQRIIYLPQWSEQQNKMEYDVALANSLNLSEDDFVLTFTGNIGRAQGFEMILAVAESIGKKGHKDIKWLLVGDGTELDNIKYSIKNNNYLRDAIVATGWKPVEEMPRYYAISDALIVVLKKDIIAQITLPGKIQSYMAAGKPIIASLGKEGESVINNAQCGFVSILGDIKGFEENVLKLYRMDPQERDILGVNASLYSERMFNKDKLLQCLEDNLRNDLRDGLLDE